MDEIAAISDSFGVELASHGGGPANMNVLCAIPNAIYMEKWRKAEAGQRRSVGPRRARHEQPTRRRLYRQTQSLKIGRAPVRQAIVFLWPVECFPPPYSGLWPHSHPSHAKFLGGPDVCLLFVILHDTLA